MNPSEDLIPLARVPRHIRAPDPPHASTVLRWVLHGVGSPPVKLETVKVGGRRYTTRAAIDAFISATSGSPAGTPSVRDRETAIRQAEHALDADNVQ